MQAVFEKIVEKLEEKARFYNSASDVDQNIRSGVIIAKEIVQETAAEYEVCYKDCGDCEAYYKEKHHCPKFCNVTKETVKEIEENHNGWISVKERLPGKAGSYLVIGKSGGAVVTRWYEPSKFYPNGHFGGNCSNYIRYWMPRPEPPQPYQDKGDYDENTN